MKTIAEVAAEVARGDAFPIAMGNFLDAFYLAPDEGMLHVPPALLPAHVPRAQEMDVYLAAAAEWLARHYKYAIPLWVFGPDRYLHVPSFGSDAAALRATLILESPPEFRSRNMFVTANALDRASRYHGRVAV
jgi:hypothetical protein